MTRGTTKPAGRRHTTRHVLLWLVAIFVVLPCLYLLSVGPASPLLRYHGGDMGYRIWTTLYGEPLGNLPRSGRSAVNWYLGVCDKAYWRIRRR